jgi:hypothetical protein
MPSLIRSTVVTSITLLLGVIGTIAVGGTLIAQPIPQQLVADVPIMKTRSGLVSYPFLPVTIQGHRATLIINPHWDGEMELSPAALSTIGVPLAATATVFDSITIGTDVQRRVPVGLIRNPNWAIHASDSAADRAAPVIGVVGVRFLRSRYDVLYDLAGQRVQLYAFPATPVAPADVWIPAEVPASACGKLLPVPPVASTFTGMEVLMDGHPVTGVLEIGPPSDNPPPDPQGRFLMNADAFKVLALPSTSSRLTPWQPPGVAPGTPVRGFMRDGLEVKDDVTGVHLAMGRDTFWTGTITNFQAVDIQEALPPQTPVVLIYAMHNMVLYTSNSGGKVCLSVRGS